MSEATAPRAHALEAILAFAAGEPEAAAFWAEDGQCAVTRGGLADLVDGMGQDLAAFGARPKDCVLLVAPPGIGTAAALVALSAYLAVAPLAPGPATELQQAVLRLKPRFVALPSGSGADRKVPDASELTGFLANAGVTVLHLAAGIVPGQGASGLLANVPARGTQARLPPLVRAGADDTALILPTSGTTGEPKLVALTHAHLGHMVRSATQALALTPRDICVNPMPLHHIHGIAIGTLLPLASGGSLVPLAAPSGAAVIRAAERTGATWYTAVPTIHQDVLRAVTQTPPEPGTLCLRFARSASSALAARTRAELMDRIGLPLLEGLGMTEASSWCLQQVLGPGLRHGPVGHAHGAEMAVLDDAGQIQHAADCVGELLLRGPNVISGYLDDHDPTRFVQGWLRTGDRVRVLPDGAAEIIGRLKEMVNRGGATLAPVQIEDSLLAHPAVAQAIAFGVPHPTLGQDLAAAVVLRPGLRVDGEAIRQWLDTRVMPEKLPRLILIVDEIPVNRVGKPQRIRAAELLADRLRGEVVPPVGPLETVLADVIAELLQRPDIGRTENIFLAGADSLLLVRLQVRIEELFGPTPGLDKLAERPSVALLAEYLGQHCDRSVLALLAAHWDGVAEGSTGGRQ